MWEGGVWGKMGRCGIVGEVSEKSASDENLHPDGCEGIGGLEWDSDGWGMDGTDEISVEVVRSVFPERPPGDWEYTGTLFGYWDYTYYFSEWNQIPRIIPPIRSYQIKYMAPYISNHLNFRLGQK